MVDETPPAPQKTQQATFDLENSWAKIDKILAKIDARMTKIEERNETPIEAQITNLKGRLLALEGLLSDETPGGKQKLSTLGKRIKFARR